MKLRYATALAAAWCACAGAAHADSFAFGTSNIRFNVIDLTPDDGTAAGFAVNDTFSTVAVRLNRPEGYRYVETDVIGLRDVAAAATIYGAHASIGVSTVLGDTVTTYSEPAPAYTNAWVRGRQDVVVTLKAHSLLVVDGDTFAQLSGWNTATDFDGRIAVTLRAGASGNFEQPYNQLVRAIDYAAGTDTVESFQLAYANPTDQDTTIRLQLQNYLSFSADRQPLAAVPEPATYALLGAGLLVVGAARRRNSVKEARHA